MRLDRPEQGAIISLDIHAGSKLSELFNFGVRQFALRGGDGKFKYQL